MKTNAWNKFINKQVFLELYINHEQDTLEEYATDLIIRIIAEFYKLRIHYICKRAINESNQSYFRTFIIS